MVSPAATRMQLKARYMNFTQNLKIGTRPGLGFGVMLLLIVAMAVTGFPGVAKLFAQAETICEDRTVPLGNLATINQLMMTNRVLVMDTLFDAASVEGNQAQVMANVARVKDGLQPVLAALRGGDVDGARRIHRDRVVPLAQTAVGWSEILVQLQVDVAAEVRNLAQRSAEASREIEGLIGASVERVDQRTALVDQAGTTMKAIVTSIQRVSDIVGEISNSWRRVLLRRLIHLADRLPHLTDPGALLDAG